jgi:intracellular septation protein
LLGEALHLPDSTWKTLTWRYGGFFVVMSAANAVIAFGQPEAIWVAFRFPGVPILAVLFSLTQTPLMLRAMREAGADPRPPAD